jgi:hypothetical protein
MSKKENNMTFIREIPIDKVTDKVYIELSNFGFVLVWREESIEVWADVVRS